MAVPTWRSMRGEVSMDNEIWSTGPAMPQGSESHLPMSVANNLSSGPEWSMSSQPPLWPEAPMEGEAPTWHGSAIEPFIMPNLEHQFLQNSDLVYGGMVTEHNPFEKSRFVYGGGNPWQWTETNGLPRYAYSFDGSDLDTNVSSSSPRSLFSEPSEHDQLFKTEAVVDYTSPRETWVGTEVYPSGSLQSIPGHVASSNVSGLDISGSRCDGFADSFPSPNTTVDSTVSQYRLRSTPPYMPDGSTSNPSQWYPSTTSMFPSILPYAQEQEKRDSSFVCGLKSASVIYPSPLRKDNGQVCPMQRAAYAASTGTGKDTQMPAMAEAQTQRKDEDTILLEGKRDGLTYKEIRKKMRTRVAESTLRGRYRSLTKERKNRVRKPVWTEKDVRLLREIVHTELNKLDDGNYRASTRSQKLAKLSWKRVAEYIANGGGSYHFGNSTCKKKWSEIDQCR